MLGAVGTVVLKGMEVRWELGFTASKGSGFAFPRGVIQVSTSMDTGSEEVGINPEPTCLLRGLLDPQKTTDPDQP